MRTRATTVGAGLVLVSGLIAGCGSSSGSAAGQPSTAPATVTPTATATASPSPVSGVQLPITGLPARGGNQNARIVAVSVVGAPGQPNPTGLASAEAVIVEFSDSYRLLALYQSVTAQGIGPVGQTRPADGPILGSLHPIYANAGGPSGFVQTLDQSGVSDINNGRNPSAFAGGAAGLTTSTASLRSASPAAAVPPPVFTFGAAGEALGSGARSVHTLTLSVPGRPAVQWTYDATAGRWHTPSAVFSAADPVSLIIQVVPYKTVQVHHPDGSYVPSARVFGHGDATIVSGASALKGLWYKPGNDAVTVFSDGNGIPVKLHPGSTWVLLAPTGSVVTYQ